EMSRLFEYDLDKRHQVEMVEGILQLTVSKGSASSGGKGGRSDRGAEGSQGGSSRSVRGRQCRPWAQGCVCSWSGINTRVAASVTRLIPPPRTSARRVGPSASRRRGLSLAG